MYEKQGMTPLKRPLDEDFYLRIQFQPTGYRRGVISVTPSKRIFIVGVGTLLGVRASDTTVCSLCTRCMLWLHVLAKVSLRSYKGKA